MEPETARDVWDRCAGLTLSGEQHVAMSRYLDLLVAANERMNLTRITDRAAAEVGHVADALTLVPHLVSHLDAGAGRVVDIGSGGGVPGMVLAIACPRAQVTLIESTGKKARFLEETAAALALSNVTVLACRAEEAGRGQLRERCDVVTARAVGALVWLAEWGLPLLKLKGKLLAMKGPRLAEELPAAQRAIRMLGGGEAVVHPVQLVGMEGHVIVEIRKVKRTGEKFPRAASNAKGKPLS